MDLTDKTDAQLQLIVDRHEAAKATKRPLYLAATKALQDRAKAEMNVDVALRHLEEIARAHRFTDYGALAKACGVRWGKARHMMFGPGKFMDQLHDACAERGLPHLTALVVLKPDVETGKMADEQVEAFFASAVRTGGANGDENPHAFRSAEVARCHEWGGAKAAKPEIRRPGTGR